MGDQRFGSDRLSGRTHHYRVYGLAPLLIRNGDHRTGGYGRVLGQSVFDFGGKHYVLQPERDLAVLDWGRGVWTYNNTWYWASASGYLDGVAFGFNLGYGFSDRSPATENLLLYDGKAHKLEQVEFHFDRSDWLKPWRVSSNDQRLALTFRPAVDRNSQLNLLAIASEQHQVFGYFSGQAVLDDGSVLQLQDFPGFAEEVRNRW